MTGFSIEKYIDLVNSLPVERETCPSDLTYNYRVYPDYDAAVGVIRDYIAQNPPGMCLWTTVGNDRIGSDNQGYTLECGFDNVPEDTDINENLISLLIELLETGKIAPRSKFPIIPDCTFRAPPNNRYVICENALQDTYLDKRTKLTDLFDKAGISYRDEWDDSHHSPFIERGGVAYDLFKAGIL